MQTDFNSIKGASKMHYYCVLVLLLTVSKSSLCQYFNNIDISIARDGQSVTINLADTVNHEKEVTSVIIKEQKIPKLKSGSFQDLPKLKFIKIQDCNMTDIEQGAFKNLPKLRLLNLGYNSLTTIKRGLFQNLEITELYLTGNAISSIEENAFKDLKYLEVIDLSRNKITVLHKSMFNGTTSLRKINLSFNYIQTVPNNFFEYAFFNYFKDPDSFIDLSDNRIDYFDVRAFKGVSNVEKLDLQNNNLQMLNSDIFEDITYIGQLNLENNNLKSLNYNILTHLTSSNEILLTANPWNCEFVKSYSKWCETYNKTNTISDYDVTECTTITP